MSNLSNINNWEVPAYETHEFAPKSTRFCTVIPVINEGDRIRTQLKDMFDQGISIQGDVIIADGGSKDGSLDEVFLRSVGINTLLVKTGPGKLSAQLRMAYSFALIRGYDGIVTIDGNGKDGVEAIPSFFKALDSGWDIIQGSRFVPGGIAVNTPRSRLVAIKLIHAPVSSLAARFHYTDTTNGFRAYSAAYLLDPRVQPFRSVFQTYELLAYLSIRGPKLRFRTIELPVARRYPDEGKIPTKISPFRGSMDLLIILAKAALGNYNSK